MKKKIIILTILSVFFLINTEKAGAQNRKLKLIFIRHGEKPQDGDNLNCQGVNRSLLLPALLYSKFGIPDHVYVPAVRTGDVTKSARMLQTITPFAAKYNLDINSAYDETDHRNIASALLNEKGTVIIVWEHKNIKLILRDLGVEDASLSWPDSDFDSIWVVTFVKGVPRLNKDREGLKPTSNCAF